MAKILCNGLITITIVMWNRTKTLDFLVIISSSVSNVLRYYVKGFKILLHSCTFPVFYLYKVQPQFFCLKVQSPGFQYISRVVFILVWTAEVILWSLLLWEFIELTLPLHDFQGPLFYNIILKGLKYHFIVAHFQFFFTLFLFVSSFWLPSQWDN